MATACPVQLWPMISTRVKRPCQRAFFLQTLTREPIGKLRVWEVSGPSLVARDSLIWRVARKCRSSAVAFLMTSA